MSAAQLPLRDIHLDVAPPWWPPAPGWWMLVVAVLLLLAVFGTLWWLRRRRRRALLAIFDRAVGAGTTPTAQIAAMSELLRRAARRVHADADRLPDAAWRKLLASGPLPTRIEGEAAELLLLGGYRAQVDAAAVKALRPLAQARFMHWMQERRK